MWYNEPHKIVLEEMVLKETIYISRNKKDISINQVIDLLHKTDWAANRDAKIIEKSINNSMCYGVFEENHNLIGFARIITDYVTTFYLMDVVVEESFRGQGIGNFLMSEIMKDVGHLYGILHTDNAQKFYENFGFTVTSISESGERIMEKRRKV